MKKDAKAESTGGMARSTGGMVSPLLADHESNPFGFSRGSRAVFIDAHPGSHIRTCGGAMLLARRLGAKVSIIEACDGAAMVEKESQGPAMARLRRKEARAAVKVLGLGKGNLYLLGFPDGGLEPVRHDYWRAQARPYYCPWLKDDRVNSPEAYERRVQFFGEAFFDLLKELFARLAPTHVFTHHDRDTHMDHRALNWFVKKALGELADEGAIAARPPVFEWITYYTRMPWPPEGHDISLADARKLPFEGQLVRYVPPPAEQEIKVRAWRENLGSHGQAYVERWTRTAEVFWVKQ